MQTSDMSKLAITGKGGAGKTTLASVLARLHAADGHKLLAIDADPDANLGAALGISNEQIQSITPIAKLEELARNDDGAGLYKMYTAGCIRGCPQAKRKKKKPKITIRKILHRR